MKRVVGITFLAVAVAAMCGTPSATARGASAPYAPITAGLSSPHRLADKLVFTVDVGIAAYCIHYVFKSYQFGYYSSGAAKRVQHLAVAAAALLIAYNRLKAADGVAHRSKSPTLHTLARPLDLLVGNTQKEYNRIHNGQFNGNDVNTLYKGLNSFESVSGSSGYAIRDIATTLPKS